MERNQPTTLTINADSLFRTQRSRLSSGFLSESSLFGFLVFATSCLVFEVLTQKGKLIIKAVIFSHSDVKVTLTCLVPKGKLVTVPIFILVNIVSCKVNVPYLIPFSLF